MEQELGFEFIKIIPDKEDFDIFKAIIEKFRYIKQQSNQLAKKTLMNKISMILLGLELKSDNTIKSKPIKCILKKYCLVMSKVV